MNLEDRVDSLAHLLRQCRGVLLDFDGPVTVLYPNGSSRAVADAMRSFLSLELPEPVATTKDPLQLLRWTQQQVPSALNSLEHICARAEIDATRTSTLTSGMAEALHALHEHGYPVAIVSNNDRRAISGFLARHRLERCVSHINSRQANRPDLMKPNPYLVRHGHRSLHLPANECMMLGDSVSDIKACLATGVHPIGWAKTPPRGQDLRAAGAQLVIRTPFEIAAALAG